MPDEGTQNVDSQQDEGQQPTETETKTFTQVELDKIVSDRLARQEKKLAGQYKDYDTLRERAAKFDQLAEASKTDMEKAVDEARKAALNEARTTFGSQLVAAEFRAHAAGKLSDEQISGLLEDLNTANYIDQNGQVDVERVKTRVGSLVVERPSDFPDLGGGSRGKAPKPQDMNAFIRQAAGHA